MPRKTSPAEKYTQRVINTLTAYRNGLLQIKYDERIGESATVIHLADFNIIHPHIWESYQRHMPKRENDDWYYDRVGRSIVELHANYKSVDGYIMAFSNETFAEMIESFAHRYERADEILNNKDKSENLLKQLRVKRDLLISTSNQPDDGYQDHIQSILSHVQNHEIKDAANRVVKMMNENILVPLSEIVGEEAIRAAKERAESDQLLYFDRLRGRRMASDGRNIDHAYFHYNVDAWALALCKNLNHAANDIQAFYVCRDGISEVVEAEDLIKVSRTPLAPYLKDVALYEASSKGDVRAEAKDILLEMEEQLSLRLKRMKGIKTMDELTKQSQAYIQGFFNKYINIRLTDYEKAKNTMEEERERAERIISSEKNFLENFEEARSNAKRGSQDIINVRPEILESRLMETRDLRENEHAVKAFKKLGIDIS